MTCPDPRGACPRPKALALAAATLAAALAWAIPAASEPTAAQLFGAQTQASPHRPAVFGSYAKGCAAGLRQLPETGPTWQAMRLSRNRNWGHPDALDFVERLSRAAAGQPGWEGLYVGDISQPRGGPMTSGHASHQLGLDVDIWMLPARSLDLSRQKRESLSSISVRASDQRRVNGNWTPAHAAILKAAASDAAVDRIFVTPPVKVALCQGRSRADYGWLQKIRPYHGHHYHFHVRLKCPGGSRGCETQRPSVRELSRGGSGCDETLLWWVTDYLDPPRSTTPPAPPAPRKRGARDYLMSDLPRQCAAVLAGR